MKSLHFQKRKEQKIIQLFMTYVGILGNEIVFATPEINLFNNALVIV